MKRRKGEPTVGELEAAARAGDPEAKATLDDMVRTFQTMARSTVANAFGGGPRGRDWTTVYLSSSSHETRLAAADRLADAALDAVAHPSADWHQERYREAVRHAYVHADLGAADDLKAHEDEVTIDKVRRWTERRLDQELRDFGTMVEATRPKGQPGRPTRDVAAFERLAQTVLDEFRRAGLPVTQARMAERMDMPLALFAHQGVQVFRLHLFDEPFHLPVVVAVVWFLPRLRLPRILPKEDAQLLPK